MNKHKCDHLDEGYTLVELLVVLLLVAIIGTALAAALTFGTRAFERSESRIATLDTWDSAHAILRSIVSSSVPRRVDGLVQFRGEPTSLVFISPGSSAAGPMGLTQTELTIVANAEGAQLFVKETSLLNRRETSSTILASHLGDATFSYLDTTEKLPIWLSYWRDRDRLPDAVRLAGEDGNWPALVIRLPVAQDASCAFDPISSTCRKS